MQKLLIVFFSIFLLKPEFSEAKNEYFMTLRHEKVNLRQGPAKDYPIKIFYKKNTCL